MSSLTPPEETLSHHVITEIKRIMSNKVPTFNFSPTGHSLGGATEVILTVANGEQLRIVAYPYSSNPNHQPHPGSDIGQFSPHGTSLGTEKQAMALIDRITAPLHVVTITRRDSPSYTNEGLAEVAETTRDTIITLYSALRASMLLLQEQARRQDERVQMVRNSIRTTSGDLTAMSRTIGTVRGGVTEHDRQLEEIRSRLDLLEAYIGQHEVGGPSKADLDSMAQYTSDHPAEEGSTAKMWLDSGCPSSRNETHMPDTSKEHCLLCKARLFVRPEIRDGDSTQVRCTGTTSSGLQCRQTIPNVGIARCRFHGDTSRA